MKSILSIHLFGALFCRLSTIVHRTLDGCRKNSYNPICSPVKGTHQNGEGPSRLVGGIRTTLV